MKTACVGAVTARICTRSFWECFLEDENFQAAKACLDGGDYEGLFQHVHEIKGISGNVSITDLYRTSSHVVALLRAKDYDNIPAAFNEMADAYKMAVEAIQAS